MKRQSPLLLTGVHSSRRHSSSSSSSPNTSSSNLPCSSATRLLVCCPRYFSRKRKSPSSRRRSQPPTPLRFFSSSFFYWCCCVSFLLLSSMNCISTAEARVPCTTSYICQTKLHPESKCNTKDGFCENPYQFGCLRMTEQQDNNKFLRDAYPSRVCNSHDPPDAIEQGLCQLPRSGITYPEIRIMSQNWESPFFESWVLQILLSEVLDVAVSIEPGVGGKNVNFYDPDTRFEYGTAYSWDGIQRASENDGDCLPFVKQNQAAEGNQQQQQDDDYEYQSCGHVMLEMWSGQEDVAKQFLDTQTIEPLSFIGVIGEEGWLIPKYTAEADSKLLSHFGLSGPENRRKLAERFLRPTTWADYCNEVSPDGCLSGNGGDGGGTNNDNTTSAPAKRPPENDDEGQRYFVNDLYTGYFRKTEENDCDKWPTNCTGHFMDYPCGWTSFFIQQAHHLDIGLKSGGNEPGSNGYPYGRMVEIWHAANWTKSDIMGYWWRPEALYQQFLGTDFELQNIYFPPTNHRCIDRRANVDVRCGDDDVARVGDPEGVCDVPPIPNYKVISTGLYKLINNPDIQEALKSPAYDVVKEFTIDGFQLGEIFDYWQKPNIDRFGFDPRDAVCRWVSENFEDVRRLIPRTYPRKLREIERSPMDNVAIGLGGFAAAATLISAGATYRYRKSRVFVFAQIEFVYLLLLGLLLVTAAALLMALPPNDTRCIANIWLLNVGYTFELVPLIVKIAAINSLMQAAKRMKRIILSRKLLFGIVAMLTTIVIVYMVIWTLFDPPAKIGDHELTGEVTDDGLHIVSVAYYCASDSRIWMLVSVGVQGVLLLCASILAFMTRKMRKDVNEANTIAFLIYWNFVCVLLRVILFLLEDNADVTRLNRSLSMILSADSFATILIYFIPKFIEKSKPMSNRHSFVSVDLRDIWRPGFMPHMEDTSTNNYAGSSPLDVSQHHNNNNNKSPKVSFAENLTNDPGVSKRKLSMVAHDSKTSISESDPSQGLSVSKNGEDGGNDDDDDDDDDINDIENEKVPVSHHRHHLHHHQGKDSDQSSTRSTSSQDVWMSNTEHAPDY